jgi:hypothetical protein
MDQIAPFICRDFLVHAPVSCSLQAPSSCSMLTPTDKATATTR